MEFQTDHFNKQWVIDELKSIIITTMTIFTVDGFAVLTKLYNGDTSKDLLVALAVILGRSLLKAVLQTLFPKVFVKKTEAA